MRRRFPRPARVLAGLLQESPYAFWLDSSMRRGDEGRFSVVGKPYAVFRSEGRAWEFFTFPPQGEGRRREKGRGNPWEAMRAIFKREASRGTGGILPRPDFPFTGGAVGILGYGLKNFLETYPLARRDLGKACLLFVRDGWLWEDGRDGARAFGKPGVPPTGKLPRRFPFSKVPRLRSSMTKEEYGRAVRRIKKHIARGDVYQANLTQRLDFTLPRPPLALLSIYMAMRRANPTPYGAYLALDDTHVASTSPERFLRVEGRRVLSEPMKGTAPRGRSRARDRALRRALERSKKNRAENLMICDLVRHDLGRVCAPGSVRVPSLFHVDAYRTLYQMVSSVEGALAPGRGAWDALEALFPPGSMTGAPKIRAASLLDEIENLPRGFYAGALGYVNFHGGAEWSVVIRTLVAQGARASYHTGGGIVADSRADAERAESMLKAQALLRALSRGKGRR